MKFFNLYRNAKRFIVQEHATTMVEYTVMLAIVAAVLLSAIEVLGPATSNTFMVTSNAVSVSEDDGVPGPDYSRRKEQGRASHSRNSAST